MNRTGVDVDSNGAAVRTTKPVNISILTIIFFLLTLSANTPPKGINKIVGTIDIAVKKP